MFRRRESLPLDERVRNLIWPRTGWWRAAKYVVHRVRRLPGTPTSIALGFACGAFISFTPLFGFHYLLAIAAAWLLRGSVLAAFLGVHLGWLYPFVLVWTYELGTRIIGAFGTLRMPADVGAAYLLHHPWSAFVPVMIGSVPFGLAIAATSFAFAYWAVTAYRGLRRARLARSVPVRRAGFGDGR
jgi:hypothetical protein